MFFTLTKQVRYYVREYGGESTSEAESVRVYKKTPRVKTLVLEDPTEVWVLSFLAPVDNHQVVSHIECVNILETSVV